MSSYTVEIQAGNADGTIWQAVHPAENIDYLGDANAVVVAVLGNQNVIDVNDGNWQIAVWDGADADTSTEPDYTLSRDEWRDAVVDALTRAE